MPEKSVREMNEMERRRHSLAARVFHATAIHSVLLGLLCFAIGLGMYMNALMQASMDEAALLARSILESVTQQVDPAVYAERATAIWKGLPEGTDPQKDEAGYYAAFAGIAADPGYQELLRLLRESRTEAMSDFFFAAADQATGTLLFIADTDPRPDHVYPVGAQERVPGLLLRLFFRRGNKEFPRSYFFRGNRGVVCVSGAYVREGDPSEGFLFVVSRADVVLKGVGKFTVRYVEAILFAVLLMGFLVTRRFKKTLVKPINDIAGAAQDYVKDKKGGETVTDHFAMLNIRTGDEVENLALIMADMERDLLDYEEYLTKIIEEKERIGTELALATRIQADMLPNSFPDRPEFDIYASMTPAKEVGGDFYDFFLIDDRHLCLVIADVSGKGIPAALFMMMSKIMLQNYAMTGRSPKDVLQDVNAQICKNNREEMFVTVWLGILDLETGVLVAANAGHEYPILKRPGGRFELVRDVHGFVIGGMDFVRYKEYELKLEPGSRLFVYTDGVAEATDAQNGLFGVERMLLTLNEAGDACPREILERVDKAVGAFVGEAPQFDDLTMLCLEYKGRPKGEKKQMNELTVAAAVENIPAVTAFVDAHLEALGCPMKAQTQINVAIDELFGNIAHYAYKSETGAVKVRVETEKDPPAALITFIDNGMPFDPLAQADPDTTLSAEERGNGGLGIFLVKKTMDDVSYTYKDGQNILTIKKRL